jgi:hypothetical protein
VAGLLGIPISHSRRGRYCSVYQLCRPYFTQKLFNPVLDGNFVGDCLPSLIFSSNNSIWAPDTRVKAFLHMAWYSRRYSAMKSIFLVVSGVNDTADHKSDP